MQTGTTKWKRLIIEGAGAIEVNIEPEKTDQFAIYAEELIKWNKKINLTAIIDPREVAVKHFIDSVAPAQIIPPFCSMLDIGSGGGFPGIPLKIMIPSLSVTLIDASQKKINFLKHVIRILKLKNIEALHARAEDLNMRCSRTEGFDVIVCRALFSLEVFVMKALPLLAKDGIIIALKGKAPEKELESLNSLTVKRPNITENRYIKFSATLKKYRLPYIESERSIIAVRIG